MKQLTKPCLLFLFFTQLLACTATNPHEYALEITKSTPPVIAVTNVSILPIHEPLILENYTIILNNGIIQGVGKDLPIPLGATIIDGRGKYLIPGIIDMHAHFYEENDLLMFLVNGVTTLRNPGGMPFHLEYKKDLEEGRLIGPECYIAGPYMDGPKPFWPFTVPVRNSDEAGELVHLFHDTGFDYIKVYSGLLADSYYTVMDTAQELGIKVIGHVPDHIGTKQAIIFGQYSIEHFYSIREEHFPLAAEFDTWVCPTFRTFQIVDQARDDYNSVHEHLQDDYFHPYWQETFTHKLEDVLGHKKPHLTFRYAPHYDDYPRKALDANVSLILGTDSTMPFVEPGFSVHEELAIFVDEGLTPYEALKVATLNGAECLEIQNRTGSIEVGKEGDMILLNSNPFEDIHNTRDIEGIFLDGVYFNRSQLDTIMEKVKQYYINHGNETSRLELFDSHEYDPVEILRNTHSK